MKLTAIDLQDFGPFRDLQRIELPKEPGVTVIYGENMRGKTFLLNAIRYALYGRILGRGARERSSDQIGNLESAAEGRFGFSVKLEFEHNDVEYELFRECQPLKGVKEPKGREDYSPSDAMLQGDGEVLSPEDRSRMLARIMPEEVARFFLFDGELLQQYEELVINESTHTTLISGAIDRILGVPVLRRAGQHCKQALVVQEGRGAREAQRHKNTAQSGVQLAEISGLVADHEKEIERLSGELAALVEEKSALEASRRTDSRARFLTTQKQQAKDTLKQRGIEKAEKEQRLKILMQDSWRSLVRDPLRRAREQARMARDAAFAAHIAHLKKGAIATGVCPVCDVALDDKRRKALSKGATNASTEIAFHSSPVLDTFDDRDVIPALVEISKRLDEIRVEISTLEGEIEDVDRQLDAKTQDEMDELDRRYVEVIKLVDARERGIVDARKKLAEWNESRRNLERKIQATGSVDVLAAQRRINLLRELADLFEAAVDRYRNRLRENVERSASELFRGMTTEQEDFTGLRINESYGLSIMHRDGSQIIIRSAGAEHIVALALMGALQKNAPLRGPIVMDSPFGRLDERHRANVIKTLPQMADQVVLLAYEQEVGGRQNLRDLLGPKLRREYEMVRHSARHTVLQRARKERQ